MQFWHKKGGVLNKKAYEKPKDGVGTFTCTSLGNCGFCGDYFGDICRKTYESANCVP